VQSGSAAAVGGRLIGRARLVRAALSLVVGITVPLGDLALDCRQPDAESCLWGGAYLTLTLGLGVVLLAPLVFGALTLLAMLRRPKHGPDADAGVAAVGGLAILVLLYLAARALAPVLREAWRL
jgi:hypothetical protein